MLANPHTYNIRLVYKKSYLYSAPHFCQSIGVIYQNERVNMREAEIQQRLKYFLGDLVMSLKPLEKTGDKIYFVKTLIELQLKIYRKEDESFIEEHFVDEYLLAKFRHKMKAFVDRNLPLYFNQDELCQENINQRLQIHPAIILDDEEFFEFTIRLNNILSVYKTNLYLTEPDRPNSANETDSLQGLVTQNSSSNLLGKTKIQNNEFSRNRQAMAMSYLFKSIGLTRNKIPLTALAKLAHLLSAMPYDNMDNSPLYGAAKEFESKETSHLLEDFKFVRKHFALVKLTEAVALIDKEIATLEDKLKFKD